jgi:bifunctional UDP-N-acetylglucosamine pyrophosphorylase/glucosamine-1-phosphate N-acetyltransferase
MITNLQAIVLAAGKSTRFNVDTSKMVEKICGQEIILYTTRLLEQLKIPTTVVVGYQKEAVQKVINTVHKDRIHFEIQEEQHGTGHAILCARNSFKEEHILIMNGDMPLVTADIIERLYSKHIESQASISFIVAHNDDPSGISYGRVVKAHDNKIKIVEAKDFNGDYTDHCFINAGIYIVSKDFLEKNLQEIEKNDDSKEFYFTDIIKIASDQSVIVTTLQTSFDRIRGINNFQELWAAEQIKRAELIKYWMDNGVRFSIAQNVHIDLDVTIGAGSYIGCGVHIQQGSKIGQNCFIHEFSSIENSILADDVTIFSHCIIKDSSIGHSAQVGPFAHVTSSSRLEAHAVIGNFVEVKRSTIGLHSKAKHLSYLGDAQIGSNVNIGAGTITCNYDGANKNQTIIKDGAFISSNNSLVAPVVVEKNAFTAAGSTITHFVPEDALAIARARQINKEGYAKKLRARAQNKDNEDSSFIGALKTKNGSKTSDPRS